MAVNDGGKLDAALHVIAGTGAWHDAALDIAPMIGEAYVNRGGQAATCARLAAPSLPSCPLPMAAAPI